MVNRSTGGAYFSGAPDLQVSAILFVKIYNVNHNHWASLATGMQRAFGKFCSGAIFSIKKTQINVSHLISRTTPSSLIPVINPKMLYKHLEKNQSPWGSCDVKPFAALHKDTK